MHNQIEFLKDQIRRVWEIIGREVISVEEYKKNRSNLRTLTELLKIEKEKK